MKFDSRLTVVAAALALPLGAALASYALAGDVKEPNVPARVQIGESNSRVPPTLPSASVPAATSSTQVVSPPLPLSDDDDGRGGDDGGGGDDDDGDDDGADDEDN
ncbi:MAG: hypothetical protein ACRDTF_23035 [Pseudonocardiaceae bacterium]